jgi:hypothetical protein
MTIRGVIAVVAGLATLSGLLFAMEWVVDAIVGTAGGAAFMRNAPAMLSWLVWEAASVAAGGFVTASIARHRPVGHAVAMGAIQALMTLAAMFSVRHDSPLWFWLLGIASMMPAAWWGGVLRRRGVRRAPFSS